MSKLACLALALLAATACGPSQKPAPQPPPPATNIEPPGVASGDPGGVVSSPPSSASPEPSATMAPDAPLPGMSWKTVDMGVAVPDDWRTCASPDECVLVVTTCCDQCNGGKAVAVQGARKTDTQLKYSSKCPGIVCTMRGCFTRASCEAGRCVLQWASAVH